MLELLPLPFLIGVVFGMGSFYGLTVFRLNSQEKKFQEYKELQKRLEDKIDKISSLVYEMKSILSNEIKNLAERVSKLEGKINGK